MIVRSRKVSTVKVTIAGLAWLSLALLFYFGQVTTPLVGHLDWSIIGSYAVVHMAMHFFLLLKKGVMLL